jgi:hypothetical protein
MLGGIHTLEPLNARLTQPSGVLKRTGHRPVHGFGHYLNPDGNGAEEL